MRMFVFHSLVFGGLSVAALGCTDDGEKMWPRPTTAGSGAAVSSSSGSESSSSSSSGTAGAGGMGGASTGGMGGTGGVGGGMGGMGGASMGGMGGMGGAAGNGGMGGSGGSMSGPADPMNLTVVLSGKDVKLDWIKSVKPTTLILRKLGSAPTDANDPAAKIVYIGTGQATLEPLRNLLPNTPTDARTYHYAAFGCDGNCGGTPASATLTPTISQCLAGGGYTLLWRHASADVCGDQTGLGTAANTSYPDWWKRCDDFCPMGQTATATARQLNANGLAESVAIGNSLKQKGISFTRMVTSEFCRNFTTAQLMNLVSMANLEYNQGVTYYVYDEANRCNNSMAIAATEPLGDGNTGVIGHAGFVCQTLDSLAWAEAAIYKPNGMGGSTYITRVKWNEWDALP